MNATLDKPIEYVKGVGPQRGDMLKKELGIFRVADLIFHFPFRYVDRTKMFKVNHITSDTQYIQLKGVITNISEAGQPRSRRLIVQFEDESGTIELVWFKGLHWVKKMLAIGVEYVVFGKPTSFNRKVNIVHPEVEPVSQIKAEKLTGLQPIYPSTEKLKTRGLDSRGLSKVIRTVMSELHPADLNEILPQSLVEKYRFLSRFEAMKLIHLPPDDKNLSIAQKRLKFEELFLIQVAMLGQRARLQQAYSGFIFEKIDDHFEHFFHHQLPFELTGAQKKVLKEIRRDVLSGKQMNRLLQGDVGSGKTVVALMTMLMAIDNGFQACMMAPTEILARQHYKSISAMLEGMEINVAILTGSVKGKARKQLLEALKEGHIHILVGTHALTEDPVQY